MIKDISKIIAFTLVGTLIVGGIISLSMWIYDCETNYTEYTYNLEELDEDVYGIYQTVVSVIPAENYKIMLVCYNGNIRKFKYSAVEILYTEEIPKITIKDYKQYKKDEIILYVPSGGIEIQGTMYLGRKG